MNQVLAATTMTFGERVAYSGKMLLIGLGTVFLVLALLWGALELFRRFLESREASGEAETPAAAPAPVQAPAAPAPVAVQTSNDEVIAVITAAVAAAMAEENGGVVPGFRVVSFRRL